MPPIGLAPWHMWGNRIDLTVGHTLVLRPETSTQLIKISYGRPDTWKWLFVASIVQADILDEAGRLRISWDLMTGVGRSLVQIPDFEVFRFVWLAGSIPLNLPKWSQAAVAPVRDDTALAVPNFVESLATQDLQLNVRCLYTDAITAIQNLTVRVDAYFAPASHIRPEWYEGRFPGGEDEGK